MEGISIYYLNPMPVRYIDSIKNKQHILLFFEDFEDARMLSFRFIKNGLAQGEQCVYATDEDSGSIVIQMLEYGIPLRYLQIGKLRVHQIQCVCSGQQEIMDNCKRDVAMLLSNLRSPFRIVSRIVKNVSTMNGMSVEIELEQLTHSHFEDFGGSLICPYDVSKIEPSRRTEWMEKLRENHHTVIYAPKFGHGSVFCQR